MSSHPAVDGTPVIVLITGMFRSGSTWSFNIARELLNLRFSPEAVYTIATDDVRATISAAPPCLAVLMKGHLLDDFGLDLIRGSQAKVIHTVRNPVEAIRSGMRAFSLPFSRCLQLVERSFVLMDEIIEAQNGCVITFADIGRRPEMLIEQIARYLDVPLDQQQCLKLIEKYSRESIHQFTDRLTTGREAMAAERNIVDIGFSYYDEETLLHRSHIGSGDPANLSEAELHTTVHALRGRIDHAGGLLIRESLFLTGTAVRRGFGLAEVRRGR